jgi:hypothetical protein
MTLQIQFIKDTITTLTVRPRQIEHEFIVRYVDGSEPNTVWVQEKSLSSTIDHIRRMITLMVSSSIFTLKIVIPSFPVISFGVNSLNDDTISDIMETISDHLEKPALQFRT